MQIFNFPYPSKRNTIGTSSIPQPLRENRKPPVPPPAAKPSIPPKKHSIPASHIFRVNGGGSKYEMSRFLQFIKQCKPFIKEGLSQSFLVAKFLCCLHVTNTYLISPVLVRPKLSFFFNFKSILFFYFLVKKIY